MLQNRRTYMTRVICNVTDEKDSFVIPKKCYSNTLLLYAKYWIMQMIKFPLEILIKCLYIFLALFYLTIFQWVFYKYNDKTSKLKVQSIEILLSCDVFQKMTNVSNLFKSWLYANVDLEQLPDKCIVSILKNGKIDNKCEPNNFEPCPISYHFMPLQKRKILVLDLDETLIHSYHENNILWRNNNQTLTKNYNYHNAHNPQAFMYCINNFYNNNYNLTRFSQLDSYLNQFCIKITTWLKPKPLGLAGQHNLKSILPTNTSLSSDALGNHLVNRKAFLASNGSVNGYAALNQFTDDTEVKAISYGSKQYLYSLIYRLYLVISIILFTLPKLFINLFLTYIYTTPLIPRKSVHAPLNIGNTNNNNSGTSLPPSLSPVANLTGLSNNLPAKEPDFTLKLCIDRHPVRFFVYKRPHVETFLSIVSQWYDLVVYTASMQIYGSGVADHLDQPLPASTSFSPPSESKGGTENWKNFPFAVNGSHPNPFSSQHSSSDFLDGLDNVDIVANASQSPKLLNNNNTNGHPSVKPNKSLSYKNTAPSRLCDGNNSNKTILSRRYYRQHCKAEPGGGFSKDLAMVDPDLSRVFILDNSPTAYRAHYPHNGIHIKSWFNDPNDRCLLDLLPFLDSLRYVSDVRSVLSRNIHALNQQQPSQSGPYTSSLAASTGAVATYNINSNITCYHGAINRPPLSLLDKFGAMGTNHTFISNQNNIPIPRSLNMDRTGGYTTNASFNKDNNITYINNSANLNLQLANAGKSYSPHSIFMENNNNNSNTANSNMNDYAINIGSNLCYAQRPSSNYTPAKAISTGPHIQITPVSTLKQSSSLTQGDSLLQNNSYPKSGKKATQQNSSNTKKGLSTGGHSFQQPINAGDNNTNTLKSSCQPGNRYFKTNPSTVVKSLNYALTSVHGPVTSTAVTQKLTPTLSRACKTSSATTKIC